MIRREPDADDTIAREKLVSTTVALRRLIFGPDELDLPLDPFWRKDGGLAFDLLSSYSEGKKVIIGHAGGVITIDLVESLDAYRESLRVALGEPYRTMLAGMVLKADQVRFAAPRDIVALSPTPMCRSSACSMTGSGWRCSSTA